MFTQLHSKQIINQSFLMKKHFKKISLLRVFFAKSSAKFGQEESCNTEHSLRFHGGGRDNLYPMIRVSGDGLSSLVQVSLPLLVLLGMLEDSAMKLVKSVVKSRVEGYGGPPSTGANSPRLLQTAV